MRILHVLIITFFLCVSQLNAQTVKKIKVKKPAENTLFFFQKGEKSDTIVKNKNDLFYLLVSDTLKSHLIIQIENGRLQKTYNDSLYQLVHIKGISYEAVYEKTPVVLDEMESKPGFRYEFKSRINGVPSQPGNVIRVTFRSEKTTKLLPENVFYYKD
ncbi:MAG: hypothetical protein K0S12_2457 [Bacteroidetes bacterium]|nr:hypothetical protein [Bacteroidota bacterium]